VLLCTLVAVYTFAAMGLSGSWQSGSGGVPGVQTGPSQTVSPDVSDEAVQTLTESLGNIVSQSDELAILPAVGGTGFTVSATISLDQSDASGVDWRQTVSDDISQYFADVYAQTQPIEDAQIYFLKAGQLVAGAGLGRQVYQQLSGTVSTGSGGLVPVIQAQPVRTNQGVMDSWAQINNQDSTQ
jgi:hypothetical protein